MLKIGCKDRYRVLHINNEIGNYVIGGAGTYMNEMYMYKHADEGFVHIKSGNFFDDIDISEYPKPEDIFVVHLEEFNKIYDIDCDILVVQFYEYADYISKEYLKDKKLVYVIHSVPTPEPAPKYDPFGGNTDVRMKFEKLCELSDVLVCVSYAEKQKLVSIYPETESKICVIYNGITYEQLPEINRNYQNGRKKYGYIGRTDYRKGILECAMAFKNIEGELHLACPKNDNAYLGRVIDCVRAAGITDKIVFHGWCVGERKTNFFNSLDALIIPSLYEPFGYVALEAMKYGIPIISSNNGGLDEILKGYRYKYNPYEEGALEKIINTFITDSNQIIDEQMDILMNNFVRFSAVEMVDKYEKLWDKLDENRV